MKKPYHIMKVGDCGFGYIAFSVDHSRPEEYLPEVEKELARKKYAGQVVFDLLMCNGPTRNRYMVASFDGEKFAAQSWRMSAPAEAPCLAKATSSYWGKANHLGNGVLTHAQQAFVARETVRHHVHPARHGNPQHALA